MRKTILGVSVSFFIMCSAYGQSVTMNDLLDLYTVAPKNIDNYLGKKGFVATDINMADKPGSMTFVAKPKKKVKDTLNVNRSITLYKEDNIQYCLLNTSSEEEYLDGKNRLTQAGFIYDSAAATTSSSSQIFQRKNISVVANTAKDESNSGYSFLLQKKELPSLDNIKYAEDLLIFDSHQYLLSFFGEKNVKQDVYYFSEKELKKCSVLFPNSSQQVTFIWDDEVGMSKLAYILISGLSPTAGALQFNAGIQQNKWMLKNGLYCNISLKELLELNKEDVEFYGRDSEFSYMVVPQATGNINFKKIGLTLGCFDCAGSDLLDGKKISAKNAVSKNLTMYVVYIMLMP